MVMGLAACGSNGAVPTASDDTQTATEAPAAEAPADTATETTEAAADVVPGIDGYEPFADQVTLRVAVYDRGDNGNGCSDVENNYWTTLMQSLA